MLALQLWVCLPKKSPLPLHIYAFLLAKEAALSIVEPVPPPDAPGHVPIWCPAHHSLPHPPLSPTCLPRSNLKRYLHYLTRYEANLQACKLEDKLRKARGAGGGWSSAHACDLRAGWRGPRLALGRTAPWTFLAPLPSLRAGEPASLNCAHRDVCRPLSPSQECEAKVDAAMETDASLSNFSWLTDALQQLFLARNCMAYRWEGHGEGGVAVA